MPGFDDSPDGDSVAFDMFGGAALGEVAFGEKDGSTVGLVTAVCKMVKSLRGPTGLGTTMISGVDENG